jgi:hypothetical protein
MTAAPAGHPDPATARRAIHVAVGAQAILLAASFAGLGWLYLHGLPAAPARPVPFAWHPAICLYLPMVLAALLAVPAGVLGVLGGLGMVRRPGPRRRPLLAASVLWLLAAMLVLTPFGGALQSWPVD